MKPALILAVVLALALCGGVSSIPQKSKEFSLIPQVQLGWADNNSTNQTQTNGTSTPAEYQHLFVFDRAFYNVTKISLSFPYTNNHTVEDISTVGYSQYSYDFETQGSSSGVFTFIADDIDIYTFTFKLEYDNASIRQILVAIWEGDLPMEGYTWTETGTEYVLQFRMNEIAEQHYPSKDEVAQQVVYNMQLWLQQMLSQQNNQLAEMQSGMLTTSIVSTMSAVGAIIAVLLAGIKIRQRRMIPEE